MFPMRFWENKQLLANDDDTDVPLVSMSVAVYKLCGFGGII